MKNLITLAIVLMGFQCMAQSEPKTYNKKDVIKKMDRSELDMDTDENMELDKSILKFDIPELQVESPKKFDKPTNKISRKIVSKPVSKQVSAVKLESKPKFADDKTAVTAKKASLNKTVNNETKTKKPTVKSKVKLVYSRNPLKNSQIKNNDKIVLRKGKTYFYRMLKDKSIIQYKYFGKLPFQSMGLSKNDENSYYVIDKDLLLSDIKMLKSKQKPKQNKKSKIKKPIKPIVDEQAKLEKNPVNRTPPDDLVTKRKAIEKKYNNGRIIKKSIHLKNLHINDKIYIIGDIEFVIRPIQSTNSKKKYWLDEKLDIENPALEKIGKNSYKVIKFYKTH